MRFGSLLSLAATAVLSLGTAAHAATISSGTQVPVVNGGQPVNLTNFTVSTAGDNQYPGSGGYTTVIAPGGTTPFLSGIAYRGGPDAIIATFSPDAAGDFNVYILDANTDGN